MQQPRILAFAYACEPGRGSEPGAGWAWAKMLAGLGETWVVTRANNRPSIEQQLLFEPLRTRLHFVYVDLPQFARTWKRGPRGVHAYYFLWQVMALSRARRLHREVHFDISWHLTFANGWFGTLAPLVGGRFVYGPVGGGTAVPWRLFPVLGPRGALYEVRRSVARAVGRYLNPMARLAWRRAELILVQNRETRDWLPRRHRARVAIFPNVALDDIPAPERPRGADVATTVLFVGNLLPLKGVALAVQVMTHLSGWTLLICGSGPDRVRLQALTRKAGVEKRVRFLGRIPRDEVLRIMQSKAAVLLFPSLHDEAGWVVAEALACGLPVVCLDIGGPPVLGGMAVPPRGPRSTAEALARAVLAAASSAPPCASPLDLASRRSQLAELLGRTGLLETRGGRPTP